MSVKRATMRAAALDRFGGVESIHVERLPIPEPGPDEVLLSTEGNEGNEGGSEMGDRG